MRLIPINRPDTSIVWQDHELRLHGEAALYWPSQRLLVVADLHLGREGILRDAGLGMPEGASETDLQRLRLLLELYRPERLVIAGDLLHAAAAAGRNGHWLARLLQLTQKSDCELIWLLGNHDRPARQQIPSGVRIEDGLVVGQVLLCHEPTDAPDQSKLASICGHLHPVLRWRDRFERLRLPAFLVDPELLILPAFSSLAGGLEMPLQPGRSLYPIAQGEILARAHG
jgi:DNA ligase-associated metallophosphoesterase